MAIPRLALLALVLFGCDRPHVPVQAPEVTTAAEPIEPLRLELARTGDADRPYSLRLVHQGPEPIVVVMPGDGSPFGWRTPSVKWIVEREDGTRVVPRLFGCGTLNQVLAEDIRELAPGEDMTFTEWIGTPQFDGPGTYAVSVHMINDPEIGRDSAYPTGPASVMEAMRSSTPFSVTSNRLTVTIE
jgi:hypothetical protein